MRVTKVLVGCCWLAALSGLGACSLDHRKLELGTGDGGEAGAFEGGESGASSAAPIGGDGSGDGAPDGLVDGCADLDTDGVADCESTLLRTPSFSSDVSNWTAEPGTELTWDAKNALADAPSGSARLNSAAARAGAFQCVTLEGEQLVIAYASAFIEAPADSADPADARLEVSFFEAGDCAGERHRYFETPAASPPEAWLTIHAGALSRDTTKSAEVALVGYKPAAAAELRVYFDNVMLKVEPP